MANHLRYSHHTQRALQHAHELARQYQHPRQDTGHLLVGVLLARGSLGAQVMDDFDVPEPVARVYLKRLIETTDTPPIIVPQDDTFNEALNLAASESDWLGHHYIGTEHLLLGITRTNVGNAIKLMHLLDITPEQLRRRVRHIISDGRYEFNLQTVRQNARLSELSRRVLNAAEHLAVSMDHPSVGLGHLVMALLQERRGITAEILTTSGVTPAQIEPLLTARDPVILVTVAVVLDVAIDQAEKFGSHYVGADHLLYALTLTPEGTALLTRGGATVDRIQRLLIKHLRP